MDNMRTCWAREKEDTYLHVNLGWEKRMASLSWYLPMTDWSTACLVMWLGSHIDLVYGLESLPLQTSPLDTLWHCHNGGWVISLFAFSSECRHTSTTTPTLSRDWAVSRPHSHTSPFKPCCCCHSAINTCLEHDSPPFPSLWLFGNATFSGIIGLLHLTIHWVLDHCLHAHQCSTILNLHGVRLKSCLNLAAFQNFTSL